MDKRVIGQKISSLRKESGLTQKELADKLCVTDKTISKWETGVNFPDITIMEDLALALGISVAELLGLEQATSEETIKEMTVISEEDKKKIKKRIKWQSWEQIFYGTIAIIALIYLSWVLHVQGLEGGVYGVCTVGILICVDGQIANGIYNLLNLKKI